MTGPLALAKLPALCRNRGESEIMPHHKSCKKRLKTSRKARLYNRAYKSHLRSNIKEFRNLTDAAEAASRLPGLASAAVALDNECTACFYTRVERAVGDLMFVDGFR